MKLILPAILTLSLLYTGCVSNSGKPPAATVLEFSPAPVPEGSRVVKMWKEKGYFINGTVAESIPHMRIMSAVESEKAYLGRHFPSNNSDYLWCTNNQIFDWEIYAKNGNIFTPISVDLAEYSPSIPKPCPVFFYGIKPDGKIVTCAFVTDGIIDGPGNEDDFETFHFPKDFIDIKRLKIPVAKFSMDNLILSE